MRIISNFIIFPTPSLKQFLILFKKENEIQRVTSLLIVAPINSLTYKLQIVHRRTTQLSSPLTWFKYEEKYHLTSRLTHLNHI